METIEDIEKQIDIIVRYISRVERYMSLTRDEDDRNRLQENLKSEIEKLNDYRDKYPELFI
jgi:hypothetical protein